MEIDTLIERVDAATDHSDELDEAIRVFFDEELIAHETMPDFYTGSLSSVLGLLNKRLPGYDFLVARISGQYEAQVGPDESFQASETKASTPALALLGAFLRAYRSSQARPE